MRIPQGIEERSGGEEVEDKVVPVQQGRNLRLRLCTVFGCQGGISRGKSRRKRAVSSAVRSSGAVRGCVLGQPTFGPIPADLGEFNKPEGPVGWINDDIAGVIVGRAGQRGGAVEVFEKVGERLSESRYTVDGHGP